MPLFRHIELKTFPTYYSSYILEDVKMFCLGLITCLAALRETRKERALSSLAKRLDCMDFSEMTHKAPLC